MPKTETAILSEGVEMNSEQQQRLAEIKRRYKQGETAWHLNDIALLFSIRGPDYVVHLRHVDCAEECPHLIAECGMFEQEKK